jgi:hypothetical protein
MNGQGIMYYSDGSIDEGIWKAGQFLQKQKTIYSQEIFKFSVLKTAFLRRPENYRNIIQKKLTSLGLYSSSIDGQYGKRTLKALLEYNKRYHNNSDLNILSNALKLIKDIISHEIIKTPKIIETKTPKPVTDYIRKVASGTGFYVSKEGHIMTNHHVIDGCQEMKVHSNGNIYNTIKIASDAQNDLALLKVKEVPPFVFALSPDGSFPLQDIIVAGFPFGDRVSSTLKFTKGIVSSVAGLGNNYSEIQIDAALQPGNSGGPIIDNYGNIIAVAVSKLDMKKILKDYGVIPENTNFGVKASVVKNLMQGNAVPFKSPSTELISKTDLSRLVTDGTVYLTCWMTSAQIQKLKKRKVMFSEFED